VTEIKHISCVIIIKDGAKTIANTLSSLNCFKEVILFDNGSTDQTIEIAQQFSNVTLVEGQFLGFGETKNKAASYASNSWVLSLDADETLSTDFTQALATQTLDDGSVYQMVRTNFYRDTEIKYCWKKEHIVRLYNTQVTAFNDNKVHEFVISDTLKKKVLAGLVNHYPYHNISDFIKKSDKYSDLFALENKGKKNSSPSKAVFNATFTFIKKYFLKRGFLDGYPGLLISFAHMSTNFFKYMKLYEINQIELNSKQR
jgi:glycosyltransferase involved in cell wall biosynthesis